MLRTFAISAALALSVAIPAKAQAQQLPNEAQVTAAARFMLPVALDGVLNACAGQLASDTYLITNRDRLRSEFETAAEGSFEEARLALFVLGGGTIGGKEQRAELDTITETMMRTIVEELIDSEVANAMNVESCAIANRVMQELAPLPAENFASLFGYLLNEAGFSQPGRQ